MSVTNKIGTRPMTDPFGEGRVRQLISGNVRLERTLRALQLRVDNHSIVAFTDRHGVILEVNDKFVEVSKYSREELIGAPQSIVKSGRHSAEFYREMWATIVKGGIWQGTFCNRAKDGSEYWVATTIVPLTDANHRVERYLSIRTDVTLMYAAEQRVRELAHTDELTQLSNRTSMLNYLAESVACEQCDERLYVTIECDDLTMINETFGFAAGDRFLRAVGEQFHELSYPEKVAGSGSPLERRPDLIARVGSATFAAAFSGFTAGARNTSARQRALAEQLAQMLDEIVRKELGSTIEPHIRVSYVAYTPGSELDAADVFSRAEVARNHLSRSVSGARIAVASFEQCMVDEARARTELVLELRQCVPAGELSLYVQPVVGQERALLGFEGLVRWNSGKRGVVAPDDFIPLAERTGIIVEIGNWVLDEACRILGEWARDEHSREYTLSVNVSERQLRPHVLAATVREALERHHAPAERLKLEVTESQLHVDLEQSIQVLTDLREIGVQISLDDFGTGYSSLSNLSQLPVQQLKIDRSFVRDVTSGRVGEATVEAIVRLAHVMNISVVAEGVETEEQFSLLRRMNIDAYQGYLFGKPEPLVC